jgi:hypothetical protein
VAVLAGQVEGRETAPVLDVHVTPLPAQHVHRPAVALPGRLVQRRVSVLDKKNTTLKYVVIRYRNDDI